MKLRCYLLAGAVASSCLSTAIAQPTFPAKPIRLIVGFAPGGNTDTVARLVGGKLGERLGTQVIIDNRSGAGGTIGTELAARANPDGYTLTMGTTTTHAIAVSAYSKLRYDPIQDFDPIGLAAIAPYLLVVQSTSPARTLKEFVSLVSSQPGKFNFASAGQATTTHLVMATLASRATLDMLHVPFKGNGPATTAVLSGEVQALFGALPPLLPHVNAGKLRALAISSAKRGQTTPNVPTVAESGYPGFDVTLWLGFFSPKGTPREILKRLESELAAAVQTDELRDQMFKQGVEAYSGSAAELAKLLKADVENYRTVFKSAGIQAQ